MHVAIFVDDLLVSSVHASDGERFLKNMNQHKTGGTPWKVRNLGRPKQFLGLEVRWNRYGVKLTHTAMIERLVERFNVCKHAVHTPMVAGKTLEPSDAAKDKPDATEYRSITGTISFIAGSARPDCAYIAKELARNLSNPSAEHMRAAKRCAQYLYTTRYDGVTYDRRMSHQPIAYCDADFANQITNRRSTSGKAIMLYGAAVLWSSRQQPTVALQSRYAKVHQSTHFLISFRHVRAKIGPMASQVAPHVLQLLAGPWGLFRSGW